MSNDEEFIIEDTNDFVPAPVGFHDAVCVDIERFPNQKTDFGPKDRCRFSFQIAKTKEDGVRFLVSKSYNEKLGSKAALRQDLDSWRGVPFTDEEVKKFNLYKLIGQPCRIQVVHEKSKKNDNVYANIKVIAPYDGTTPLQPLNYVRVKDRPKNDDGAGSNSARSSQSSQPMQPPPTGMVTADQINGTAVRGARF